MHDQSLGERPAQPHTHALAWVNTLTQGSSQTRRMPAETSRGTSGTGTPGCWKAPGQRERSALLGASAHPFANIPLHRRAPGWQEGLPGSLPSSLLGPCPCPGVQDSSEVSAAGEPPVIPLQPSSAPRGQEGVHARGLRPLTSPPGCRWVALFPPKTRGAGGVHPGAGTRRNNKSGV